MKETTLAQFSREPQTVVQVAQQERILVTQNGKPVALVVGLENRDEEDWQLEMSLDFWQMIEERRKRPTMPFQEVIATLFDE